jgi:hypothetical protein
MIPIVVTTDSSAQPIKIERMLCSFSVASDQCL